MSQSEGKLKKAMRPGYAGLTTLGIAMFCAVVSGMNAFFKSTSCMDRHRHIVLYKYQKELC